LSQLLNLIYLTGFPLQRGAKGFIMRVVQLFKSTDISYKGGCGDAAKDFFILDDERRGITGGGQRSFFPITQ
jgi:hypothetical protein